MANIDKLYVELVKWNGIMNQMNGHGSRSNVYKKIQRLEDEIIDQWRINESNKLSRQFFKPSKTERVVEGVHEKSKNRRRRSDASQHTIGINRI